MALWIIIPTLVYSNISTDSIEILFWGRELQAGYYKHPPFASWFIEFFVTFLGKHDVVVFFASQVGLLLSVIPLILLAGERHSKEAAFYTSLIIYSLYVVEIATVKYNVNAGSVFFWPWIIYVFHRIERNPHLALWILLGVLGGFGILGKYINGLVLVGIVTWCVLFRRDLLKTYKPWLAVLTTIVIVSPHLKWLSENDFAPFQYLSSRVNSVEDIGVFGHIFWPARLLFGGFFASSVLPLLALLICKRGFYVFNTQNLKRFYTELSQDSLLFLTVFPIIFLITICIFLGQKISTMWALPMFFIPAPLFGMLLCGKSIKYGKVFFSVALMGIYVITGVGDIIYRIQGPSTHSRDFFGNQKGKTKLKTVLSEKAEKLWYDHYDYPLPYIVGPLYDSGAVAWYGTANAKERPRVFEDADLKKSPWINVDDLHSKGGIYISGEDFIDPSKSVFGMCPRYITAMNRVIWGRNSDQNSIVWVAILPPTINGGVGKNGICP
jgi:hypothetical protein